MWHGGRFDWSGYIKLAAILDIRAEKEDKDHSLKEAASRSAISRAYYGSYCLARNLAVVRDNLTLYEGRQKGKNHGKVISHFRDDPVDPVKQKIGQDLDRLRKSRNEADYDDSSKMNHNHSKRDVCLAKGVEKRINKFVKTLGH